jgi:DNA mismatch endonuclease (patch repair protein)
MYGERPPPARAHMPGSRGFLCAVSRTYIRDGRAPVPKDPRTSALMSRIRPRDTGPERALRQGLMARGLSGYRLHPAHVPGRPDVAYIGLRVAVFVHGCFWHGCPHCSPRRPATHTTFWNTKLDRNRERDARKARALRQAGWRVLTIWECRLRKDHSGQVRRVERAVAAARAQR